MADSTTESKGECFVISPIGQKDSLEHTFFMDVFKAIIQPAAKAADYDPVIRADAISSGGKITHQIIEKLIEAPLVIADLTNRNPNVFYELALRHALAKPFVQIELQDQPPLPFDVHDMRTIPYNLQAPHHETAIKEIFEFIKEAEKNPAKLYTVIQHERMTKAIMSSPEVSGASPVSEINKYLLVSMDRVANQVDLLSNGIQHLKKERNRGAGSKSFADQLNVLVDREIAKIDPKSLLSPQPQKPGEDFWSYIKRTSTRMFDPPPIKKKPTRKKRK